jgi:hypothetical protein
MQMTVAPPSLGETQVSQSYRRHGTGTRAEATKCSYWLARSAAIFSKQALFSRQRPH